MNFLESYLYWRGDLSFDQDPLNEIDGLILSELSYIDYPSLSSPMPETIGEAAKVWDQLHVTDLVSEDEIIRKPAFDLLLSCGKSSRFSDLVLKNFVYDLSEEDGSQFGAITYAHQGQDLFVAFQGTDLHVIGWKEDFSLSYLPYIPAQNKARDYLRSCLKDLQGKIKVGGHSKGGNLAIYSLIFQEESLQDKVELVYNYDGPGFNASILKEEGYLRILPKIRTYVPQDSLVGLLLHRLEEEIVIDSTDRGLRQHMGYNWKIEKNFFQLTSLSKDAQKFALILDRSLEQLDQKQRKDLTDAVFSLFGEEMEGNLVMGTLPYNIRKFKQALYQLTKLPAQSKKLLFDVLLVLIHHRLEWDDSLEENF